MASYNVQMNMLNESGTYDIIFPKIDINNMNRISTNKFILYDADSYIENPDYNNFNITAYNKLNLKANGIYLNGKIYGANDSVNFLKYYEVSYVGTGVTPDNYTVGDWQKIPSEMYNSITDIKFIGMYKSGTALGLYSNRGQITFGNTPYDYLTNDWLGNHYWPVAINESKQYLDYNFTILGQGSNIVRYELYKGYQFGIQLGIYKDYNGSGPYFSVSVTGKGDGTLHGTIETEYFNTFWNANTVEYTVFVMGY